MDYRPPSSSDAYKLISELVADFLYCFSVSEAGDGFRLEWATGRLEEVTGFTPAEIEAGGGLAGIIHPGDADEVADHARRLLSGDDDVIEFRVVTKAGEVRRLRGHARPLVDRASRRVSGIVGAAQDVTERRREQDELRDSRSRLNALIEHAPVGIVQIDQDACVTVWNPAAERIFGWTAEETLGRPLPYIPPDKRDEALALIGRGLEGEPHLGLKMERQRKDGARITIMLWSAPVYDAQGVVTASIGAFEDMTDRVQAEEALRVEREFSILLLDTMPVFFVAIDARVTTLRMNRALLEAVEYTAEEVSGLPYLSTFVPEEEHAAVAAVFRSIADAGEFSLNENHIVSRSGRTFLVEWRGRPVLGADGTLDFFVGVGIDITSRRQAEEERRKMEWQLLQSQRMESVGRLAGGVAHDFNNMLQTILGYADMALAEVPADSLLAEYVWEMRGAAERSADLTRQLLAFARRQTIAPRILDVNERVEGLLGMLERLIGEQITLTWRPAAGLPSVRLDPSQLDQLLTNLVVNARDATPGAGEIVIETGHAVLDEAYCVGREGLEPGDFVTLTVSDTGRGMDRATLDRAFDPFFTTKVVGCGTGLGLATVYGIVKQNSGSITAYSEPGRGSTFRVYLPAFGGPVEEPSVPRIGASLVGGSETVLVVEDEVTILDLTRRQLEGLGYRVLSAGRPAEALAKAAAHDGPLHLLVTDVVMPGMDGRELASRLQAVRPGLRCLFMSGYTANVIAHRGVLDEGVHFLEKPFTQAALAAKVREALDTTGTLPAEPREPPPEGV